MDDRVHTLHQTWPEACYKPSASERWDERGFRRLSTATGWPSDASLVESPRAMMASSTRTGKRKEPGGRPHDRGSLLALSPMSSTPCPWPPGP